MPIVFNDGTAATPFGSTTVSISSSTYYIDDSSATTPVTVVDIPDEVGSPRKQVAVSGKTTGTMTLQLETTSSLIPAPGTLFVVPAMYGASGSNAFSASITEVGTPRSNNTYATCTIGWVKKLN
jgi:hypothetical protein